MKTIADHLFDILENSVNAKSSKVIVKISFNNNLFCCQIIDNGIPTILENITDPFVTSRKTRKVGLGLPLLKATAESTGGYLNLALSCKGRGTRLEFVVNMKHIDARPFGDLSSVFSDILRSWREVDFELFINKSNEVNGNKILDTAELKKSLGINTLDDNEILDYVKKHVKEELINIGIDNQFGIMLN